MDKNKTTFNNKYLIVDQFYQMKKDEKEYIIEVQVCSNCHLHSWCSRHQQSKYNEFFQHFKSKAQSISTRIVVMKNNIPLGYKKIGGKSQVGQNRYFDLGSNQIAMFPRFGAFQIYFNKLLVFSKLKSGLWPHVDRIAQLIQMIIKSHGKGQDIYKYSLDYRIKHDQTEYFLQTYKAQIIRQLGSARKQSKSLQKIGESPHKNFKTRKMLTNSKYKANGQMTDSSPIINKNKFNLFENNSQRPFSRDKHLHTKQNENQQKLVESVQEKQMEIHEWKISKKSPKNMFNYKNNSNESALKSPYSRKHDKQYLHKESSPKIQGEKNPSFLSKKLDKLKLNTDRLKNEEEIKKKMKQEEQKARDEKNEVKQRKQKIESTVNGWSQNRTDSESFQDNSKTKVESENDGKTVDKLAKKPSIRQNLQFPSHGTILESQNTKADNDLSNKKISQKGKQVKISTNQKMEMNKNQGIGSDILGSEKSDEQNYENENYFEQAESEISWQADKIYMRYKQTMNWTCKLTKSISASGKQQQVFELAQVPEKTALDSIQTSQILKHPNNSIREQQKIQKPIQMSWNAIYMNRQFILLQHGQEYQHQHNKQKSVMKDIQDQYSLVDDVELGDQVVRIQEDSELGHTDEDILMGVEDQHDHYHIQIQEVHDPSDLGSARNKNAQHGNIIYDLAAINQFQQLDWQADHIQSSWNIERVQKNKNTQHKNKNKSTQQCGNSKSQEQQAKTDENENNKSKVGKKNVQKRQKKIEHYNWTGVYSKGQFQISQAVDEEQQIAGL